MFLDAVNPYSGKTVLIETRFLQKYNFKEIDHFRFTVLAQKSCVAVKTFFIFLNAISVMPRFTLLEFICILVWIESENK